VRTALTRELQTVLEPLYARFYDRYVEIDNIIMVLAGIRDSPPRLQSSLRKLKTTAPAVSPCMRAFTIDMWRSIKAVANTSSTTRQAYQYSWRSCLESSQRSAHLALHVKGFVSRHHIIEACVERFELVLNWSARCALR
jgi:hypothetical protein